MSGLVSIFKKCINALKECKVPNLQFLKQNCRLLGAEVCTSPGWRSLVFEVGAHMVMCVSPGESPEVP